MNKVKVRLDDSIETPPMLKSVMVPQEKFFWIDWVRISHTCSLVPPILLFPFLLEFRWSRAHVPHLRIAQTEWEALIRIMGAFPL